MLAGVEFNQRSPSRALGGISLAAVSFHHKYGVKGGVRAQSRQPDAAPGGIQLLHDQPVVNFDVHR